MTELAPLRLFEVEVGRYGVGMIYARSRSAAIASAWRSDAFSGYTFKQFLGLRPRARLRTEAPEPDGYDYVRRVHGVHPKIGQRVSLRNEMTWTGREGVVLYPGTSSAHVKVLVDGEQNPVIVHPANVVLL